MTKIIAACNQKGGVGKTSTSVSLSTALALTGHKTLLVDLDPQGNATSGMGVNKHELKKSIYHLLLENASLSEVLMETQVENLFLIPSNDFLSGAEVELVSELGRENKLKKVLSQIDPAFEYVLIDCPPSLGLLTINALTAAQSILVPIQCEYYALEGLSQLMKTYQLIKDNLNGTLEIEGIVLTMADFRTKLTQEVIQEVRKHFGDKVFQTVIPRNVKLSEAPGFGKPIFLYDKDSEGARKYEELAKEVLARRSAPAAAPSPQSYQTVQKEG